MIPGSKEIIEENGYQGLAISIIRLAVWDYEQAILKLEKNPFDDDAIRAYKRTIRFFKSQWFELLCDIPGEVVMDTVQEKLWKIQESKSKGTIKRGRRVKF